MKLWLLTPAGGTDSKGSPWYSTYDMNHGFIVRAKTEARAREMANTQSADEGAIWDNPKHVICKELTAEGNEAVIMADFHAG